jgi:hypothetical protein
LTPLHRSAGACALAGALAACAGASTTATTVTTAPATTTTVTTPIAYARVLEGMDGWLYLGEDVQRACEPALSIGDTLDRLARLDRAITRSGRRFLLVIAPDKSSVFPDHLPEDYAGAACATTRKREFWRQFRADPPVATQVELITPLLEEQRRAGEPVFRKLDTHWTPLGATVYARELADLLEPSLWVGTRVERTGARRAGGDLAQLLGQPRQERVVEWTIVRPGVQGNFDRVGPGVVPAAVRNTSTGVALFGPRTALLVDSFSLPQVSGSAVYSLFADASVLYTEAAAPATIALEIAGADVVVVEAVERYLVGGGTVLLAGATLDAIDAALRP